MRKPVNNSNNSNNSNTSNTSNNFLCPTCQHRQKQYQGPYYCGLTARDIKQYNDEPDCANYQPEEE